MSSGPATGALDGVLVADFSRVLAGPYMTMMLGDLGATVIKVESAEGDQTRGWGPPWHNGQSTYYQALNRNKRSVVFDLRDVGDRELAVALVSEADVVVENFLPGKMATFGLGYEEMSALNPGLVYCSVSGFGAQPGGATRPGYDLLVQALGGLMSITGEEDGRPMKVGVALVDVLCGLHAGIGILAALTSRAHTGLGQLIEVNLLSSLLAGMTNQASAYLLAGVVPQRAGNVHPSVAPYELFEAVDGDLVIAAGSERQFAALCCILDAEDLVTDERFSSNAARVSNRAALRARLDQKLASRRSAELLVALEEAGVPAGPVNDLADAFAVASAYGLDTLWEIDGSQYVRAPFTMSGTPPRPSGPPPVLDEAGTDVREWLSGLRPPPWQSAGARPGQLADGTAVPSVAQPTKT